MKYYWYICYCCWYDVTFVQCCYSVHCWLCIHFVVVLEYHSVDVMMLLFITLFCSADIVLWPKLTVDMKLLLIVGIVCWCTLMTCWKLCLLLMTYLQCGICWIVVSMILLTWWSITIVVVLLIYLVVIIWYSVFYWR